MNKLKNANVQTMINLASNVVAMLVSALIGFFLSPYIVDHLGAEANAFTQLANNFVTYASLITIALNSMAARFISINYHRNKIEEANKYYCALIIGNIAIVCVLIVPAILCILNLEKLINIKQTGLLDVKLLFAFVFANFFVTQIISVFYIAMYVMNKLVWQNIVNLVKTVFNALTLLVIFGVFSPKVFYVSLLGLLLSICSVPIYYKIKKRILPDVKFNVKHFKLQHIFTLLKSGIWNTINQCGTVMMTGLDLLMANLFLNPIQMGALAVAKTIPNYIIQLGGMINNNFSPNLTIAYASQNEESILRQLHVSMKISSVFMSIPIVVFCVFGVEFYGLWMPTLNAVQLTILSFLTCMAFVPFAGPQTLYNVYTTKNKLKVNAVSFLIGGVLNFAVVYLLLVFTDMGIYAIAGVSSVITIIRNLCITVPYTAYLLHLKWYVFYRDVGISLICCGITAVISLLAKWMITPSGWLSLAAAVVVACFISLLAQIFILLTKQERKALTTSLIRR